MRHARRIHRWFGLGLALSLVATAAAVLGVRAWDRDRAWVRHSNEVRIELGELAGDLFAAEMFHRGFLVAGAVDDPAPYWLAVDRARRSITRLGQMISDNPFQQRRLGSIAALVGRQIDRMHASQAALGRGDYGEAVVELDDSKRDLDAIRMRLANMAAHESELYGERKGRAGASLQFAVDASKVGILLAIGLMGWSWWRLRRHGVEQLRLLGRLRESEQSARRSEAVHRALAAHLPRTAVMLFDHDLRFFLADGELIREAGTQLVGKTVSEVAAPDQRLEQERAFRAALAGAESLIQVERDARHFSLHLTPVRDGERGVVAGLAMVRDVSDQKRVERDLILRAADAQSASLLDELTGLYNRRGLMHHGTAIRRRCLNEGRATSVIFVDLDGLKPINDTLGHEAGDTAIREAASLLRGCVRDDDDVVARVGGDELVCVLSGNGSSHVVARIEAALEQANRQLGRRYPLRMSVGVAVSASDEPLESLVARADAAMYETKQRRRAA